MVDRELFEANTLSERTDSGGVIYPLLVDDDGDFHTIENGEVYQWYPEEEDCVDSDDDSEDRELSREEFEMILGDRAYDNLVDERLLGEW